MAVSTEKESSPHSDLVRKRNERFLETEHLRTDLQGRSFRGGAVTLGCQAAKFLLGLGSTAALARLLRPQDFGLLAMVTSITAFVHLFKDLGLSSATVQRAQITQEQVSFLFWVNVALSLLATLVVLSLGPVIAWFYHEPRLLWITTLLALNFVFSGLIVQHQALLRRQMQFKALAVRDVIATTCGIATGITLAWFGFGYWSLVAVVITTNVTGSILIWIICDWRPSRFQRRVGARSMLAFGGNLTAFNALNYLTVNFDNILIGRVLGASPLGIYTKSYGLLMLPISQINMPMASVMLPGLSRLQADPSEYARLFINAVRAIALVTVPIVVFSFFLSRDIVLVLLGRKWLTVAPMFQLMAPAALFGAISFVPGWLCQSLGRSDRQLHYALISTPVFIGGFLVGIKWGIAGVAVSYSITFGICFWAYVWYSSKESPVRFREIAATFVSTFLPSLLGGAVVWALRRSLAADLQPVVALILLGLIFLSIYIAGVAITPKNRALMSSGIASAKGLVSRQHRSCDYADR
jgi:O-antigen/teichoic acid export membrane protein